MSNRSIIFGVGGLVIGAFVGVLFGGSMSANRIDEAVFNAMERAQATAGEASTATQDAIAALGERISAIETSLSDSAASTSEISESVRAQLGEMQEALSARIDAVGDAAGESTAALRSALAEWSSGMGGSPQSTDAAGEAPEEGFRPGQTVRLADGALRVFVSGLASDGSAARIAVNGVATQSVGVGESVDVTVDDRDCTVTVTGVGDGMVGLEGSCG